MAKQDDENEKISEEAMPTENLPEVLIAEILSRLPVKSLLRFRCACKLWCALVTDPAFVKMHLSRSLASNSNLSLILQDNHGDENIYSVDFDACQRLAPLKLVHPFESDNIVNEVEVMGSCNGLLCISVNDVEIFFWNPSTRRHQKLPIRPMQYPGQFNTLCGFGYDPTTTDYKFVSIVTDPDYSVYPEVMIYSLSTNSWRRIGDMPFDISLGPGTGIPANSAFHWVGYSLASSFFVVSFDLKNEELRDVPLPDFVDENFKMDIGVLGGQLCLLCNFSGIRVEVWVMKDYGVRDSWEKLFSIKLPSVIRPSFYISPVCYSKNGELLLRKDYNSLVLYDPCRGRARKFRIHGFVPESFQTIPYVRSLVPLNTKDLTEEKGRTMPKMELYKQKGRKRTQCRRRRRKRRGSRGLMSDWWSVLDKVGYTEVFRKMKQEMQMTEVDSGSLAMN